MSAMKEVGIWIIDKDGSNGRWMTNGDHVTPWFGSEEEASWLIGERVPFHSGYVSYEIKPKPEGLVPR